MFTPSWMVKQMLSNIDIKKMVNKINSTFLEPSAGDGAFLAEIIDQKLNYVDSISNKKTWKNNAICATMSIYAIEYMNDNLIIAKFRIINSIVNHYQHFFQKKLSGNSEFFKSIKLVVNLNIVQGNTITFINNKNEKIVFNEWKIIDNKVKRIPFSFESLFNKNEFEKHGKQLDLFSKYDSLCKHKEMIYKTVSPLKVYKEELCRNE